MAWLKVGDSAATFPALMSVMGTLGADERTVNEVAGFLFRIAAQAAAHRTDYVVDVGTVWMIGGPRTELLLRMCTQAGLLTKASRRGRPDAYRIVDDEEFVNMRSRAEIDWERQQGKDVRDLRITVHVRRRDGDQCRWCRVVVQWRGRTSNRKATFDHLVPGQAATVETLVISCARCNFARQDNPQWVDDHPLLPPPEVPLYGRWSAEFLTDNGYPTSPNIGAEARRPGDPDPARDAASVSVRPGGAATEPLELDQKWPGKSGPRPRESRSAGSGRDGSSSGGSGSGLARGRSESGGDRTPSPRPRRRGRRGGRSGVSVRGDAR